MSCREKLDGKQLGDLRREADTDREENKPPASPTSLTLKTKYHRNILLANLVPQQNQRRDTRTRDQT